MRLDVVSQFISRLQDALEQENEDLRAGRTVGLEQHISRKNHALLELGRALEGVSVDQLNANDKRQLESLRKVLGQNTFMLRQHMDAAQELSRLVRDVVQASESDGTYCQGGYSAAGRRQ